MESSEYYQAPQVRARIREYCGARVDTPGSVTARFLVVDGRATLGLGIPRRETVASPQELDQALARSADVFRSVGPGIGAGDAGC